MSTQSQDIANEDLFAGIEYNEAIVGALSTIHESLVAFSEMADSKANIMITVCSILLGLAIAKIEQGVLVMPLSFFVHFLPRRRSKARSRLTSCHRDRT